MTTMSFKTFTFPHNPERITVTTETRIATAHCPEYGPIHQNLGLARRIIQAEGVFYGANAKTQLEMSRNVQSGNTQNLKSMVIQRSFPKWSVAERRKTAAASD